jgi:hypothetical protein
MFIATLVVGIRRQRRAMAEFDEDPELPDRSPAHVGGQEDSGSS